MKLKHSIIVSFIFLFIFFSMSFVSANNITFSPGELVNITGIKCLDQNNTDCSEDIVCTISIIYQNNTVIILNQSMDVHDSGFRSYNTGLTPEQEVTYSAVVNCENGGIEPFLVVVSYDEDDVDTHYYLYGSLLFFGIVFSLYGFKKDKMIYVILSGFMFLLVGINIIANGFPNIDNQYISGSSGIVLLGIGASFIFHEISKLGKVEEDIE